MASDSDPGGARPAYWEGAAKLFDGRTARAQETPVTIGPEGLEIRTGEAAGEYRRGDLALLENNEDDSLLTLSLPRHPGFVLEFRDPRAAEWLRSAGLLGRPPFAGLSLAGKATVLLALLAAFTAFMYFIGLNLAVEGVVRILPRQIDRLLGDAVIKSLEDSVAAPAEGPARRALEKSRDLVQGLHPASGDSIRIRVVADTTVKNAFAFPGGHIVVYTGLLRMLETQEEWMGLIAHEGGHIHLRHGMRHVVRSTLLAVGVSLVFGDVGGIGSVLVDNASTLTSLSYGRQAESEADDFAHRRLEAAGHSAAGLVSLFKKLLELQAWPEWAAFLSTHPSTEHRIRRLEGVRKSGAPLLTDEEWAALRKL